MAFVLHHKTIEEYPSHSSELCHRVNDEVTFPGSRQRRPGVQASPDNCLPVILAKGDKDLEAYARGHLRAESDVQSCSSNTAAPSLPWNQNPVPVSLSLHFLVIPSSVRQHAKGEALSSDRSRFTPVCPGGRHLRSLSVYPGRKEETTPTTQALLPGLRR